MSYKSDVMRKIHRHINSAMLEIRRIGVDGHFVDEVTLEMMLISDIENMMDRIADSVYGKIKGAEGDCDE